MNVCHECKDLRAEIASLRAELAAERRRADEAEEVIFRIQTHMVNQCEDLCVLVPSSDTPVFYFDNDRGGFDFWQLAAKLTPVGDVPIGEAQDE